MFGGIILETCLFVLLLYVPGVNFVFGGRQLPFFLLGFPGMAFSLLLLCWE
jgi:sodium/potassium-transporting ATPase subunit alpha